MVKITLQIEPFSKPRGKLGGSHIYHNSKEYKKWRDDFYNRLKYLYDKKFGNFFCLVYLFKISVLKTGRRQDLDNLVGGVNDTLSVYWVDDDNWGIIRRFWVEADSCIGNSNITIYICKTPVEFLEVFCQIHLMRSLESVKQVYLKLSSI